MEKDKEKEPPIVYNFMSLGKIHTILCRVRSLFWPIENALGGFQINFMDLVALGREIHFA